MDSITKERRSWNMSRIRSRNTSPEISVRKALTSLGFRYRLHVKTLPGKPDVVIKKYKVVLFINGCFWHQHEGCKRKTMPKSNIDYWTAKLKRNIEKQKRDIVLLTEAGWRTIIVWECEAKQSEELVSVLKSRLFI